MGVEPEEEFVSDDELSSLLGRWVAPGPSRVLDKRIQTSFAREFSGADEVVLMKFCSVCKEEFADKFSFCPVDGTPLVVAPVKEEPSVTVIKKEESAPPPSVNLSGVADETPVATSKPSYAAAASSSALMAREEYHLTIM